METLTRGMAVLALDDRVIGSVSAVNRCCFQFARPAGDFEESVAGGGIYKVQTGEVTLICYEAESHRYGCPIHPPVANRSPRAVSMPRSRTHSGQLAAMPLFRGR